jgi:uncharacterized protein
MLFAAAAAIFFRVNFAISVSLVWITNPLTIPPLFYTAYKVGAWILQSPAYKGPVQYTWEWASSQVDTFLIPFLLGCLICATVLSLAGYFTVRFLWLLSVLRHQRQRKKRQDSE